MKPPTENVYVMLDSPLRKVAPGWVALVVLQGHDTVRGEVPFDASQEDVERFAREKCPRPNMANLVILLTEVRNRFAGQHDEVE